MKHIFVVFGLLILAAVGVSWAATTPTTPTIRQILVECPDWDHAQACPSAIRDFIAGRLPATDQSDRQMGSLAVQLVKALENQKGGIPEDVCMDVSTAIGILAKAMKSPGQTALLENIAVNLCNDTVQTGAINPPNGNGGNENGGGGNENGGGGNENGGNGNGGNGGESSQSSEPSNENGGGGNENGGNGGEQSSSSSEQSSSSSEQSSSSSSEQSSSSSSEQSSSSSSEQSSSSSEQSSSSSSSQPPSSSEENGGCKDDDTDDDGNCGNGNDEDRCDNDNGPGCPVLYRPPFDLTEKTWTVITA